MTGLRKEIAKHVVLNVLETLSEDDFVTIYSFSKTPRPLVKCFSNNIDGEERAELVQVCLLCAIYTEAANKKMIRFQQLIIV